MLISAPKPAEKVARKTFTSLCVYKCKCNCVSSLSVLLCFLYIYNILCDNWLKTTLTRNHHSFRPCTPLIIISAPTVQSTLLPSFHNNISSTGSSRSLIFQFSHFLCRPSRQHFGLTCFRTTTLRQQFVD